MLGNVPSEDTTIVADLEAGIGTLTRMAEATIDVALVVVEATPKSLEVGQRAVEVAALKDVRTIIVVANRVRSEADRAVIDAAFPGCEIMSVPDDPAIVAADRDGVAPLDRAADSPAVVALAAIADRLGAI